MQENTEKLNFCECCLLTGRTLNQISDCRKRKYFTYIISEIGMVPADVILVCWECDARLSSAIGFHRQVQECQNKLRDHTLRAEGQSSGLGLNNGPRLSTSIVQHSMYPPESEFQLELVKTEECRSDNEENSTIIELEKYEDNTYESDEVDLSLANLINTQIDEKALSINKIVKKKRKKKEFNVIKIKKSEVEEERKDIKNSEEFRNATYKCYTCLIVFEDTDSQEKHTKCKHDKGQGDHQCNICQAVFISQDELRSHTQRHMRRYACASCGKRFITKRLVMEHHAACGNVDKHQMRFNENSQDEGDIEDTVALRSVSPEELVAATKKKIGEKTKTPGHYPCESCEKVFKWKPSLRKHLERHRILSGETQTPFCELCNLTFAHSDIYKKHINWSIKHRKQLELKGLKKPKEQGTSPSKSDDLPRISCPLCNARFLYKGNLNRHMKNHEARSSGELYCVTCDKRFSSLETYQYHMDFNKAHAPEKQTWKHECDECGKRFVEKRRLKEHIDYEHLKKYHHRCVPCDKVFTSKSSLYLHQTALHADTVAEHLCDHCGRSFKTAQRLKSHVYVTHSNQTYNCKHCPATFSWLSCLSRHVKVVHEKIKYKRKPKSKKSKTEEQTLLSAV